MRKKMNQENQGGSDLFDSQVKHLESLEHEGYQPYGHRFERTSNALGCKEQFTEGREVRLAGRITGCRDMGKTKFWDLTDGSGKIQLFFNPKVTEEKSLALLAYLGAGDIVGLAGSLFTTKTGEISLRVAQLWPLSKALRPLPEKYHGLKDVESRHRQRYLDLIANPSVREIFIQRSKVLSCLRNELVGQGYLEVETPMLQTRSGGASARPFQTHHNALGVELFLRIAPELYLKRLLVGGFEKVFELNRNFRNEGLSRRHNPEFTMLEIYAAYEDYSDMLNLCEALIKSCALTLGLQSEFQLPGGEKVPLDRPFVRMTLEEALLTHAGIPRGEEALLREAAKNEEIEGWDSLDSGILKCELFERKVESKLIQPTFITDYPAVVSPLAKRNAQNPEVAERFELFMDGWEIANAYSELNNPIQQKKNFEDQIAKNLDETGQKTVDWDYLRALEHGMPPAGGLGIGVDRLVMMLTGEGSIREVILFPTLKPES